MKLYTLFLTVLFIFVIDIFPAPFDTGYIEWEQPDQTMFVARSWGDEFEWWMETEDGYQIISGPDNYYYYAILNENGEFTYSKNKVGIDDPISESYQLERSPERLAEIEAERETFNQQLDDNYDEFMNKFDGPSAPPLKLAIVLIDFDDNLHSENYVKEHFDTMFFSTDYYFTDPLNPVIKSPDEEWVYGSLRDYYRDQSLNKLDIVGKIGSERSIINPEDPSNPGKPLWVNMPEEKSYYSGFLASAVMELAKTQTESELNIDLDQYDRVGFIFAGNNRNSVNGTWPSAYGKMFTCWERYEYINDDETFLHIGIPSHEFAHTLGAADEYFGKNENHPMNWGLMAYGCYNGGDNGFYNNKGSCPSPLCPPYRLRFNWVSPIVLEPQEDFIVQYNYSSPYFYKINIPSSNEYFIIERRRKDSYDLYTPKYENPNDPPKGILVWHISPGHFGANDFVQLESADNTYPPEFDVRFPLTNTIQDFTDFTLPSSNLRNENSSFISIKNIEWVGNTQGYAKMDYINEVIQITGTQTWSTDTSISLPVYIKDGGTLNIINGANILINGNVIEQVGFIVENGGTLNLTGSENNKVVILSGSTEQPITKWKGIEIYGNGILNCDYAVIQDALYPIQSFENNATCSLNNTEVKENPVSVRGNVTIENSIFINASLVIFQSNLGSKLSRNVFSSQLTNNYVRLTNPIDSYLEVTNCTFNGMYNGLLFGIGGVNFGDRTNQIILKNNIFSNCNNSIKINYGSISISYNNFYNNAINENLGTNYLEVNPLYVDPQNNDFSLQWGSSCIDAGHPSTFYNDPDGTRNDIGAKYFHQYTLTTSVIGGWQTLSVPVFLNDYTKTVVWQTANSNAYSLCGSGYVAQNILQNGTGYYISFPSVQDIFYVGGTLDQFSIPVCADWNIVGSITEEVPISTNICLFPAGNSFIGLVYIYKNGYQLTNTIVPGMGHWVRVSMAGSMLVNHEPVECDSRESISDEGMDHFIVTDAEGKKQDLYVANLNLYPSLENIDLLMPPPLPEIGFDARFEEGEYIKTVEPDSGVVELVINVDAEDYPVTVDWELNPENGIEYSITTEGLGKYSGDNRIKKTGSMTLTSGEKFRMNALAKEMVKNEIPTEYKLGQNFPNPFNPTTIIRYDLPEASEIKLTVFDILGREIKILVNEIKQPGFYEAAFDAGNLPSGVYVYRLETKNFTKSQKMVLIK